ncbi:MAG TPA: rhodanese-related sulfurtransferase [Woeseiaceae bacterium]
MRVVSFYHFVDIPQPDELATGLQALCDRASLLGTILVANEGVNGTLAGEVPEIESILDYLTGALQLSSPLAGRWSDAAKAPFRRMRVRVKDEIVTLGLPDVRPQHGTGTHVSPEYWNRLLDRADTLVIDTRNHYEVEVGTFPGSVDPGTDSFRQFADFARGIGAADKKRPVAMFCTGGIRCEKASALLLELGFGEVYQLQGGVLNYLEQMNGEDNRWHGECFVFDSRVAIDRDLAEGRYVQCHACRRPLSSEDLESAHYREGVSCPRCISDLEAGRAERLEERRRQVALASARGEAHIGAVLPGKKVN